MAHPVTEPGPTQRLSRDRSLRIVASFAIPIAQLEVPGGADLAARLRPVLLDKEKDPAVRNERRRNTQYGALFESRFDLFRWPQAPVQELARVVHGAVGSLVQQLNDYSAAEMQAFELQYHAWFHVTRRAATRACITTPTPPGPGSSAWIPATRWPGARTAARCVFTIPVYRRCGPIREIAV